MNLEACPGCGFQEFDQQPSAIPGFKLSYCLQCRTAWTSPQPSPEELESYYRPGYYGPENVKFIKPIEMVVEWMNQVRARRLHRLLQARGKVLEIGCGFDERIFAQERRKSFKPGHFRKEADISENKCVLSREARYGDIASL